MAGMASGYDFSVATFSPDGRVFQVEYAANAVNMSGAAVGVACSDGVLLGVEKLMGSKMMVPGSSPRAFGVDTHACIVISGFIADGRQIVEHAIKEAKQYKNVFGEPIPGKVLAERVAALVHAYTLYWTVRPFGASVLVGIYDKQSNITPELWCIEPSGTCYKYYAMAIGKGRQIAKTELEKTKLHDKKCVESLKDLATILHQVHEDNKDRNMEMEMCWIAPQSDFKFAFVPRELVKEAEQQAVATLEQGYA